MFSFYVNFACRFFFFHSSVFPFSFRNYFCNSFISFFDLKYFRNKFVFCFVLNLLFFSSPLFSAVLINEFLYDAVGSDTGQEWVELYNTGSSTVSLEGWTLQSDSNQFPGTVKATLCGSIAPNGNYLIKETLSTISTSTWADLVSGTLALGNASSKADGIQILDQNGVVQDRVIYGAPDSDQLCGSDCSNAPAVSAGSTLSRVTNGSAIFVERTASNITPLSGSRNCSSSCPSHSGVIKGFITECAPSSPNSDFIEIFITESTNLCGVQLYEAETLIKTFPSVTPKSSLFGSYIILNASIKNTTEPDDTDQQGDRDFDGIIDLYSDESSPGLAGSVNNNITLKNADGTWVDFLSWATPTDNSYSSFKQTQYDAATSTDKWNPDCNSNDLNCYIAGSVLWQNVSSESLSRKINTSGQPQVSLPSRASDWHISTPSPGKGYSNSVQPAGHFLEIFQSPFSPDGDGLYTEAVFSYRVQLNSMVTIQIFDVRGKRIRTILDHSVARTDETQIAVWNGRNADFQIVQVGIYIVLIQVENADGSTDSDQATVILGKHL